ncbi:uncharacterized protein B0P05DRAFT_549442 [Gilbertella persicaria]|uniref:uncharacterized protein n=1 Tax=Gilbertella persicaria TaxID=101096 RepID=UPI002220B06A|nr:uncharacterized protein B0P05DRAFT_549442 [Gilbertella persicaria]KAI8072241.1 hypothetical protein B0P05DRAFT_549442 [Gilbertella persicaria]
MVNKAAFLFVLSTLAGELLARSTYESNNYSNVNQKYSSLMKRDDVEWTCSNDDTPSLMLTHFAAVFFGDFSTTGGQDILGPLAVKGKFQANNYMVNANGNPDCSDPNDVKGYALVVDGKVDASDVRVKGAAQVPSGTTGLQETAGSCKINQGGKGIYDFNEARKNALAASEILAGMKPNMVLNSDGKLSSIGSSTDGFHVLTFSTCNDGKCNPFPGDMSDPSALLQGKGNWNGPQGMSWPKSGTLLLNIPVDSGSTFTLLGNLVTQGMDPCRVIFNFYSSNNNGKFTSGSFTLKRQTGSNLGAFVLAPQANIIDGSTGAFAGTVIGKDYTWGSSGIEIHNYKAAGGTCDTFQGCIPITHHTPPPPVVITTTTTTKSSTTTSTTGANTTKSSTTTSTGTTTTTGCQMTTTPATSTTSDHKSTTTTSCNHQKTTTTSCNHTKTTTSNHHKTTTDCNHSKTTTGKHHKTTASCSHHKITTTGCNHSKTTTGKHHKTTTGCNHNKTTTGKHQKKTTTSKHHKHTTTKGCSCERHSTTKHHSTKTKHHSTKTCSKHHSTKTKHHSTKTCSYTKPHKTTVGPKKHHPTTCPIGCVQKTATVTKVIYVTAA